MKVLLVVLAIFVAAAWANEEGEQDETEIMEIEDPAHHKSKYCGTKKVCVTTKPECYDVLKIVDKCTTSCHTIKKCYKTHNPYGYYPKKVCKPIKKCKKSCFKVPTTTVLGKKCRPGRKSCKTVPKKCYYKPKMYKPYYPSMHHYHKPAHKPCYKTTCVDVKDTKCKIAFFTRHQKVCTPKKYKCGHSYDYYRPKYCYKKVCKTIGIKTPKSVCTPIVKKKCSKVLTKCPMKKMYY